MNELLFIEELNSRLLENEKIFKFRSAELSKGRFFSIELLVNSYLYNELFNKELQIKVEKAIKEILPKDFVIKVRYTKTITTPDLIRKALFEFILREKPTFYDNFLASEVDIEITGTIIYINIKLEKFLCDYANSSELGIEMATELTKDFMEEFEIIFVEIPNLTEVMEDIVVENIAYSIRFVHVAVNKMLWGNITRSPRYIVDIKDKANTDVCICGVISDINEKFIAKIGKNLFTFKLYDTTAFMSCKMFLNVARKDQALVAQSMQSGNTFIMEGQIKYDSFENALIFMANRVAFCTIDYKSIDTTPKYLTEREEYLYVHPAKYEELIQADMLSEGIPKVLFNKTFVVFDLETTGLSTEDNGITEIGAVKIVNGRITETFTTLVNPEVEITKVNSDITGITYEMIKNERKIADVIGDFYKFTRGDDVVLVAHNAKFDMGFINKFAAINNYLFDNAVIDTCILAKQKVHYKKYNLGFLCEKFQIPLVDAHRALNDAMATAKLFMKLFCME